MAITYRDMVPQLLKELNELRRNPSNYAHNLQRKIPQFHVNQFIRQNQVPVQTKEGPAAVQEAIGALRSHPPLMGLDPSAALSSACQRHANDIGRSGGITHEGNDSSTLVQRVEAVGEWEGNLVEVLDFGSTSAQEIIFNLLVDDGLTSRFHRQTLLNDSYVQVGIGIAQHDKFESVCVIVLASSFREKVGFNRIEASASSGPKIIDEANDWMVGAISLATEIHTTIEANSERKALVKKWTMEDGTVTTTAKPIS